MPDKKNILFSILLFFYPVLVFLGFRYFSPEKTNLIILFLLGIRIFIFKKQGPIEKVMLIVTSFMLFISVLGLVFNKSELVKLYPVFINLSLGVVFLESLGKNKTPIIQKIASLREKLDEKGIEYTRKVTIVWLLFFILNGLISLYTYLFATLEVWTFYNAFLSYVFIFLLFAVEFLVRQIVKRMA